MATVNVYPATADGGVAVAGSNASTVSAGTVQFATSPTVTFGLNGSTITASASVAAAPNMSMWISPIEPAQNVFAISAVSRAIFWPLNPHGGMPGAMSWDTFGLAMSNASNVTTADSHTLKVTLGLYQLSNATRISLINSVAWTTGLAASASSYSNIYGGMRMITLNSSEWSSRPSVSAGGSYWMGALISTSGTPPANFSVMGIRPDAIARSFSGAVGVMATDKPGLPWNGFYTATTAAMPAAVSWGEVICNTAASDQGQGLLPTVGAVQGISWL